MFRGYWRDGWVSDSDNILDRSWSRILFFRSLIEGGDWDNTSLVKLQFDSSFSSRYLHCFTMLIDMTSEAAKELKTRERREWFEPSVMKGKLATEYAGAH